MDVILILTIDSLLTTGFLMAQEHLTFEEEELAWVDFQFDNILPTLKSNFFENIIVFQ